MSLIDRVAGIRDPDAPEDLQRIAISQLIAGFRGLALSLFTVAQFKSFLDLDAGEQVEVDVLVSKYTSLPVGAARTAFIDFLEVLFTLAELGVPGFTTRTELQALIDAY